MKIRFHKNFKKQYRKLVKKDKEKVEERLNLFLDDQFDSVLKNHPLKGKYLDYRSIDIKGDLKAIYKYISSDGCVFVTIGNHNNLYK